MKQCLEFGTEIVTSPEVTIKYFCIEGVNKRHLLNRKPNCRGKVGMLYSGHGGDSVCVIHDHGVAIYEWEELTEWKNI